MDDDDERDRSHLPLGGTQKEIETLRDLRKTDYFDRVQMKLKKVAKDLDVSEMIERIRKFDDNNQGRVKVHHFINILKHNYCPYIFDQATLLGL
jgi:hypothetical protein